jgi:phospholipid N-methyltransferase
MGSFKVFKFLGGFLTNPFEVGSVIPSSKYLARAILKELDFSRIGLIVEYGPGTGAFTKFLFTAIENSKAQLRLIEFNQEFVTYLEKRFPGVVVRKDRAANVKNILTRPDEKVDVVISSLPFTFFPWEETASTIKETYEVLNKGGVFRTYLYLHTLPLSKHRRLLALLRDLFGGVESWTCFANVPPALVIECRKK